MNNDTLKALLNTYYKKISLSNDKKEILYLLSDYIHVCKGNKNLLNEIISNQHLKIPYRVLEYKISLLDQIIEYNDNNSKNFNLKEKLKNDGDFMEIFYIAILKENNSPKPIQIMDNVKLNLSRLHIYISAILKSEPQSEDLQYKFGDFEFNHNTSLLTVHKSLITIPFTGSNEILLCKFLFKKRKVGFTKSWDIVYQSIFSTTPNPNDLQMFKDLITNFNKKLKKFGIHQCFLRYKNKEIILNIG